MPTQALRAAALLATLAAGAATSAAAQNPLAGYTVHIAATHWLGDRSYTAHHWFKPLRDGVLQGLVYFTTPPVEGTSLRDRLARERQLPVDEAVRIAAELVEALVYAHGHDVRHGDLRPKHLLFARGGITVAGFGLVEALDLAAAGSAGSTAVTIGAPAYLSPEQLSGETGADERSDVYSSGCILFEMLAGEPPFAGGNLAAVLSRKLTQPAPRVRALRESVPPALDALVDRCLARLPADRFQRATEAREALQAAR